MELPEIEYNQNFFSIEWLFPVNEHINWYKTKFTIERTKKKNSKNKTAQKDIFSKATSLYLPTYLFFIFIKELPFKGSFFMVIYIIWKKEKKKERECADEFWLNSYGFSLIKNKNFEKEFGF